MIEAIGTYLPVWEDRGRRRPGGDEDAVTMAVAAGLAALSVGSSPVERVVFLTRALPLVEGGNAAALIAGLGLPAGTPVIEQIGGAAAALDAVLGGVPGTLILTADVERAAGAAAALLGTSGRALRHVGRVVRSLPVVASDLHGGQHDYSDARLSRDRGLLESVRRLGDIGSPVAVAGVGDKEARSLCGTAPPALPTQGASAVFFALAALTDPAAEGVLLAVDQASITAAHVAAGSVLLARDERPPRPVPRAKAHPGPPIPISLPAYDRAFESKLRWAASTCAATGELEFPPRPVGAVRDAANEVVLTPLPRTGEVYTTSTIYVPVPGKATPYQVVITALDGVEARALVGVTGAEAGSVAIGDRGSLVLRRVEVRSGIPDYGYAFRPDENVRTDEGSAA
jgi:uncharacterized OB-fold protein